MPNGGVGSSIESARSLWEKKPVLSTGLRTGARDGLPGAREVFGLLGLGFG